MPGRRRHGAHEDRGTAPAGRPARALGGSAGAAREPARPGPRPGVAQRAGARTHRPAPPAALAQRPLPGIRGPCAREPRRGGRRFTGRHLQ
jgi:hypothetical protein